MSARAKGEQAEGALLRSRLLDAAAELLLTSAWSDISMAAIAAQAGVSRQTLYNEFGSREEFAQTFALRASRAFLSSVEAAVARHADDPCRAIEVAFACFLREAEQSPMVQAILLPGRGAEELLALFTTRGGPVIELAGLHLTELLRKHWPIDDGAALQVVVDGLVRLAISHASLPTSSPARAARSVSALFAPYVRNLLVPVAAPRRARGRAAPR